jgi:regulator of sigma E protease
VQRGNDEVTIAKVPVTALTDNYGGATSYTSLDGVAAYPIVHLDYSLGEAAGAGFVKTGDNVALIFNSLKAIAQGSQPLKNLSGPIGIGKLTGDVARSGGGFLGLLQLMGLLGANLFFVNMLPFPALDGGRFLFVLIELLTRKRIPANVETIVNLAGMALLLIFIAYVSFFDVIRTWFS